MKRIGIIGAGIRGRLFAEVVRASPHAMVAGVADPHVRPEWIGETPFYNDHTQLLRQSALDGVVVATPDYAHRDPVIAVANAGLPMLVEKPFATTTQDSEAMAEAIVRNAVPVTVGFENRWNPHLVRIREAIDAGELGRPVWQQAELSNTQYVPLEMLSWAGRSSPVWFLMPHTVDLVTWFARSSVTSVRAVGSRGILRAQGTDTWDAVQALLTFENGSSATLTSSWVLPASTPGMVEFTYAFNGATGAVRADVIDQGLTVLADELRRQAPLGGPVGGQLVGAPVWMMQSFLDSLVRGAFGASGLRTGMAVTATLVAVEESLNTGMTVVPSKLPGWLPDAVATADDPGEAGERSATAP
ncbi:Gfo/Idh/MocA family oxidoreductase [Georgenia satyanarayanai]|uniref:Gfo/Idh/MocA family protein n=1 Tax=Georgenia satyanarayanai TaxID=860221 RepID=UPI00203BBEF4|nr:Gfo/Idh/MocA family oxidoreductase [Georgenia satyanarayanai]MCM3661394.1 Gfo/Idh/MocA family oxidoreductase [Georgenia satyanarayanai]